VQKEISFYSHQLGKQISGIYSLFGRMMTVTTSDGRQKSAPLGGGNPEMLARLTLDKLEAEKSESGRSPTNLQNQDRPLPGKKKPGTRCGVRRAELRRGTR
jgi:hypothetical protein